MFIAGGFVSIFYSGRVVAYATAPGVGPMPGGRSPFVPAQPSPFPVCSLSVPVLFLFVFLYRLERFSALVYEGFFSALCQLGLGALIDSH